jgi:hypothetical protein
MLGVELDDSRRIGPAHGGCAVGPDGSRPIVWMIKRMIKAHPTQNRIPRQAGSRAGRQLSSRRRPPDPPHASDAFPGRLPLGPTHLHQMRPSERAGAMIDRPAGRRQGITSTDRGWTWQEESAVAFAGGDYEIRIKGRLSDRLLAAFEGLTTTVQPVETVLHGPVQDPGGALRPAGPDPVAGPGVG